MMRTMNQHERRLSVCSSDSGYSNAFKNALAENKTMQSYETSQDYVEAMTGDLAEWFNLLYEVNLSVETFFDALGDGVLLCQHAVEVQSAGQEFIKLNDTRKLPMKIGNIIPQIPDKGPGFRRTAQPGTFLARDNVANFILWVRSFGIPDSLTFETEDLVLLKNIRNVIVCLLEVARIGAKFGMEVPEIVHLEEEIDAEIEADINNSNRSVDSGTMCDVSDCDAASENNDLDYDDTESLDSQGKGKMRPKKERSYNSNHPAPSSNYVRKPLYQKPDRGYGKKERPKVDMKSLDEMVREILAQCTCEETFPMKRVKEGKYLFGDKSTLIFVRILRNHVMVRVGGGWSTLNDFLEKYDACRKCNKQIVTRISVPSASLNGTNCKSNEASPSTSNSLMPPPSEQSPESKLHSSTANESSHQQTSISEDKSQIEANKLFVTPPPGESTTATLDPDVLLDQLNFSKSPSDVIPCSNLDNNHSNTSTSKETSLSDSVDRSKPRKKSSTVTSGTSTLDRKKCTPVSSTGNGGSLGRRSSMTTVEIKQRNSTTTTTKVNTPVRKKSFQSTQESPMRPNSSNNARNRSNSLFTMESPLAKNCNSLSATSNGPIGSRINSKNSPSTNSTTNSSTRSNLNSTLRTRASTTSQVNSRSDMGKDSLSKSLPFKSSPNAKASTPPRISETSRPASAINIGSIPKSSKIALLSKNSRPNSSRATPEKESTPPKQSVTSVSSQSNDLHTNRKASRIPVCTQSLAKKSLIHQSSASAPTSGSPSPSSSRRNSITEKVKSERKGTYTPTKISSLQYQKDEAVSNIKKAAEALNESSDVDE